MKDNEKGIFEHLKYHVAGTLVVIAGTVGYLYYIGLI